MWNNLFKDPEKKERFIKYFMEWEERINSFLEYNFDYSSRSRDAGGGFEAPPARAEGSLDGMPYGVKDNIAVRDYRLTCASKVLEHFVSPYNAAVIDSLASAGAFPLGKCNMDEFGMGSSNDNSALGITNNPWDPERVAGGSSGGPAAAAAAGLVPFTLGSDSGGSVRQPASFCGVYGFKPTYGAVSRYGLVAYASSLDVVGILSRDLQIIEKVFDAVKGIDEKDQTSVDYPQDNSKLPEKPVFTFLGGDLGLDRPVEKAYRECISVLKGKGFEVREITVPSLEYMIPAYYTIATAEASANMARYTGICYGYRSKKADNPLDLVKKTRHESFGDEVKLRILLGTYVLRSGFQDRYYIKAQKIRTRIIKDLEDIFKTSDLLLLPVFPTAAFRHGDADLTAYQQKVADKFTATANLAGIPALSFPAGVHDRLPVGLQLFAPHFREKLLFHAASLLKDVFPVPDPPGYRRIEDI